MEKINDPLLGSDPKRQHPFFNSVILGIAMFLILSLDIPNPYYLSNIENFFTLTLDVVAIIIAPFIITKLREKISFLISICIFFVVFIINSNITAISVLSLIIQPFGYRLLWIAAGTFIMTISERSNIGLNFGLFFGSTSLMQALFQVSTNGFSYISIIVFIFFSVVAVILILLLKNPCCEQNENITVAGSDAHSYFNASVYPFSVLMDKEFILLIPSIFLYGLMEILFPYGIVFTTTSFFYVTQNLNGSMEFLYAAISVIVGIVFDKFEKRFLLFGLGGIGLLASVLNIGFSHTTCCSQGQTNLGYAAVVLNSITQSGFIVFIFALLGLLYLDCRSLSVNVCLQLVSLAGFIVMYLIFYFASYIGSFYIFFAVFIIACLGIFRFLSTNDKEIN
ncbi:hypothetical protein RB653_005155 [Dictyostelium firmibasis]|uniref:Uncharacterized protein n=1 Tax=Dictyostelium firmibasis TaxID=79012 RepID=A0AAN7UB01_9MYCE